MNLGKRHYCYGVREEHIDAIGTCIFLTLQASFELTYQDQSAFQQAWASIKVQMLHHSDEKNGTASTAVQDTPQVQIGGEFAVNVAVQLDQ